MDISGKTAIVTGAASGIGLGIATALAEAGANVVMADIQKESVEQAAHGLSNTNKQVMPVRIDVTQEQSVLDALAEAERNFGKLHIACNNAGVPMHGARLFDVPQGDWEFVIGVNIWGVINGIRHFVPAILRHGEEGHIVNTASVAGFQNRRGTNQGPYSMSKYAVLSCPKHWSTNSKAPMSGSRYYARGRSTRISLAAPVTARTTWGGRKFRAREEAVLAERLATTGLDPKKVGERVVDAIRTRPLVPNMKYRPSPAIIGLPLCNCSRLIPG
jgi:NAD(P)-dependent dehydrogenase (short-subunit alcohol dehydrogenase family)